ncbi:TonB-dependent receptor [Rheinheimera sp. UJ51]|uniref:TonB-dependent receptor n=1 Tax=Rheinheimera sp. UJ51 TaxID=2892446 RepID=UPI001E38E4E4|nr:TonB-dependent receptor [Rheinheimera sp. UJ51]MCC5450680.1 TonB-dependent receptor [Rheinheimera sp. UJ51]
MNQKSALALLIAASLTSTSAFANTISGKIVDSKGKPLANASLNVAGSASKTVSDENGQFLLTDVPVNQVEVHFSARRYGHSNAQFTVPASGLTDVTLVLQASSIEIIDVTISPLHASIIESSLPISVLAGDKLKMQQATTLGDTLSKQVGVHSTFQGGVASSPIIRGLDGPRVLIMQNGLDAGDASRVGPDHSVATEASTAKQIEVLRGPATLFYGSGAIGGVVNVVDERVPSNSTPRAEWITELQSVDSAKLVAGNMVTGNSDYAVYLDGFWRDSINYRTPGDWQGELDDHSDHDHDEAEHDEAEHDEHSTKRIANTFSTSKGFTLGGSKLLDNGFVGLAYGRLERDFGMPGHSHGDEEELTQAEKTQDRVQLQSELYFTDHWIRQFNSRLAFTDYQHTEIENGEVGTVFTNKSQEARFELLHRPWFDWKGGLSLHYKFSDFGAVGEEAFSPASETRTLGLGWMTERHFGPVLLQLGARVEQVRLDAAEVKLVDLELHGDEAEHAGEEHGAEIADFAFAERYNPFSVSAGLVWDFQEGYNVGLSFSHAERAPSAAELLSFGPHLGTRSYEVGALFQLNEDRDGFELNEATQGLERSRNLDLTLRKFHGNVGWVLNAFYNRVDNYYYAGNTGLYAEFAHEGEEPEAEHDHADELPVYLYTTDSVTLHGFEGQVNWQLDEFYHLTVQADYIRARLRSGGELPRTPPLRLMTELAYQGEQFDADFSVSRYFKQDNTATLEEATPGYTMVDASVSYRFNWGQQALVAYVKAQNITDELALVHTSFLRDVTPLPGRNFALGLRGSF